MLDQFTGWNVVRLLRRSAPSPKRSDGGRSGVERVIANRPTWVKKQISDLEARLLADEIRASGATRALEIGCASGFSGAVIYAQLAEGNPDEYEIRAFDRSTRCYFDIFRKTGEAFWELHGTSARGSFTTGVTSADIGKPDWRFSPSGALADFAFIDASHRAPWPALDLLSLARFLKEDAVIALHDIDLVFRKKFRDRNGPRDLFRCWQGEKWFYEAAPNIGFLRRGSDATLFKSLAIALMCDWDEEIRADLLRQYHCIAGSYGEKVSVILESVLSGESQGRAPNRFVRSGAPAAVFLAT